MPKETRNAAGLSQFKTKLVGKLSSSILPISLYSLEDGRTLLVRISYRSNWSYEASAAVGPLEWWGVSDSWLYYHEYEFPTGISVNEDEPMYDIQGRLIGGSTKAKEATPKFEPPIWEEREV